MGVNCPMSTRARVQVAMSTSAGHRTVHGVSQKPPFRARFLRHGSAWRWVWVALRATTFLLCRHDHVFLRASCLSCAGACLLQPGPPGCARGVPSQLGQKFAFDRDGSKDRRSHVTPTGTAFFIHGRDSGSYTHVQRARVTVRVNAGVHRTFGRHLAQRVEEKKKGM